VLAHEWESSTKGPGPSTLNLDPILHPKHSLLPISSNPPHPGAAGVRSVGASVAHSRRHVLIRHPRVQQRQRAWSSSASAVRIVRRRRGSTPRLHRSGRITRSSYCTWSTPAAHQLDPFGGDRHRTYGPRRPRDATPGGHRKVYWRFRKFCRLRLGEILPRVKLFCSGRIQTSPSDAKRQLIINLSLRATQNDA
jgi:hypothetical protein